MTPRKWLMTLLGVMTRSLGTTGLGSAQLFVAAPAGAHGPSRLFVFLQTLRRSVFVRGSVLASGVPDPGSGVFSGMDVGVSTLPGLG